MPLNEKTVLKQGNINIEIETHNSSFTPYNGFDKPKFYGRRKGRTIRKAKSTLLEAFLPEIKITDESVFDKEKLFGKPVEKVALEIGF